MSKRCVSYRFGYWVISPLQIVEVAAVSRIIINITLLRFRDLEALNLPFVRLRTLDSRE